MPDLTQEMTTTNSRFKSKRLDKKQIALIWKKTGIKFFMLGYHWELYHLIEENPNISVKEICEAMPKFYHYKESQYNYTNVPTIYEDIDYIMSSPQTHKIIIKDEGRFRLGTEEECIEYAAKLYLQGKVAMAKYGAVKNRISQDGQGRLFDQYLKNIDESSGDPFIEAFVKYVTRKEEKRE